MMWLGLAIGVAVGGLLWNLKGALLLGFIGWLAGLIIGSNRKQAGQPVAVTAPNDSVAVRLERLERRYAQLEARLARMEAPVHVTPAEAGAHLDATDALGPRLRGDDESARERAYFSLTSLITSRKSSTSEKLR
jgi:hypothetical protein